MITSLYFCDSILIQHKPVPTNVLLLWLPLDCGNCFDFLNLDILTETQINSYSVDYTIFAVFKKKEINSLLGHVYLPYFSYCLFSYLVFNES